LNVDYRAIEIRINHVIRRADKNIIDTEQDILARAFWRDRLGAAALARDMWARARVGASRFGATGSFQRGRPFATGRTQPAQPCVEYITGVHE